ncbi:hypothetical protein T484DRAFT_1903078, partial [Baffinella frigidus]
HVHKRWRGLCGSSPRGTAWETASSSPSSASSRPASSSSRQALEFCIVGIPSSFSASSGVGAVEVGDDAGIENGASLEIRCKTGDGADFGGTVVSEVVLDGVTDTELLLHAVLSGAECTVGSPVFYKDRLVAIVTRPSLPDEGLRATRLAAIKHKLQRRSQEDLAFDRLPVPHGSNTVRPPANDTKGSEAAVARPTQSRPAVANVKPEKKSWEGTAGGNAPEATVRPRSWGGRAVAW